MRSPKSPAVSRPVERVDRRLDGGAEAAHDLARVPLLEEGEVRVDLVDLSAQCRLCPLAGAREVLVDLPGRQLPGDRAVVLADFEHRLDQPVECRRRQAGRVARPLVLRERIEEEAFLVVRRHAGLAAPLERDDVREPGLDRHRRRVHRDGRLRHGVYECQHATIGICREATYYSDYSQILRITAEISHQRLGWVNAVDYLLRCGFVVVDRPTGTRAYSTMEDGAVRQELHRPGGGPAGVDRVRGWSCGGISGVGRRIWSRAALRPRAGRSTTW